jgi:hypothetical protein
VHLLPAVVPRGEFPRAEVVPVRLARKVAPLFGVPWVDQPFDCTWVCDFATVTLAEIARGAPLPRRSEQATSPLGRSGSPGWHREGRAIRSHDGAALPGTVANATLNRYGPDTKAAVVLTAANRLLQDATGAVAAVAAQLAQTGVHPQVRLAAWAGLVLEVYRGQPALVVAAIQARSVQRSLTGRWEGQFSSGDLASTAARCELGAEPSEDPQHPRRFDLIETTLPLLSLDDTATGGPGRPLSNDRLDDIADAWCRRLIRLGQLGRGIVWVAETDAGHRQVHTCLRVGAMIAPFVAEVFDGSTLPHGGLIPTLPQAPADLSPMTLRAHAAALHAAVNYLRYRDEILTAQPDLRGTTRQAVHDADQVLGSCLGTNDPASVLLGTYGAYLDVWDGLRSPGSGDDLHRMIADLLSQLTHVSQLWRAAQLDPGTASYLLEIGCVALGQAADLPGANGAGQLPTRTLDRLWRDCLASRGLTAGRELAGAVGRLAPSQVFHLHNYATHLARRDDTRHLRAALAIQEAVCAARDHAAASEPAGFAARHAAARGAHEIAAWIAARLATQQPAPRDRAGLVAAARLHARAVLQSPEFDQLISAPAGTGAARVARHLSAALGQTLASESADLDDAERDLVDRLGAAAAAQARSAPGPVGAWLTTGLTDFPPAQRSGATD